MRGKVSPCTGVVPDSGITPAYAGKSCFGAAARFGPGDHPRVCGEKGDLVPIYLDEVGSPPRMRGKARGLARLSSSMGITPAYAGKSPLTSYLFLFDGGSPPRMRGKVRHQRRVVRAKRITPAYAGKSSTSCRWKSGRKDHPRVCGEKTGSCRSRRYRRGSPPRMRGKVDCAAASGTGTGITPAYAGKSSWNALVVVS